MSAGSANLPVRGRGQSDIVDREQKLLGKIKRRERVSRNVNDLHEGQLTFGQKVADGLAEVAGSWNFIIVFLLLILAWIAINSFLLLERPWDPYPFILL